MNIDDKLKDKEGDKMMELYIRTECPYCQRVMKSLEMMELKEGENYKLIAAGEGTPGRKVILEVGGKGQVPFLIDGETNMYESGDIVEYIREKYNK